MAPLSRGDEPKKGHICPPSTATHPADRWETAFIYSFICKFTKIKQEVEGLDAVSDLEEALLFNEPHHILEQTLARFMLNLRPQTRNISPDIISSTVSAYFAEMFSKGEMSIFWDEAMMRNVDPFEKADFFGLDWSMKLRILRQLVEWQLSHSVEIKGLIDRAWGVVHMKHKKTNQEIAQETQQLPDDDPYSKKKLMMVPLGQDVKKTRYWAVDSSPRLYVSTNPWKVTATFTKVSSTKEEYLKVIEDLKDNSPSPPKSGAKRPKTDAAHFALIKQLESRIELVDQEVQKIAKSKKKLLQKQMAAAQIAEMSLRGPRTRRVSKKPDYVYYNGEDEEDEEEDFIDDTYEDRMDDEADFINDDAMSEDDEYNYKNGVGKSRGRPQRAAALAGAERRRSTRTTASGSKAHTSQAEWRGERRSARLGPAADDTFDYQPPVKRPRTVSSATPSLHEEIMDLDAPPEPPKATALRPNEIAVPQVAGKKKSKYWFYAVEPIPGTAIPEKPREESDATSSAVFMMNTNGASTGTTDIPTSTSPEADRGNDAMVTITAENSSINGTNGTVGLSPVTS